LFIFVSVGVFHPLSRRIVSTTHAPLRAVKIRGLLIILSGALIRRDAPNVRTLDHSGYTFDLPGDRRSGRSIIHAELMGGRLFDAATVLCYSLGRFSLRRSSVR
jgi:hypothetical protein